MRVRLPPQSFVRTTARLAVGGAGDICCGSGAGCSHLLPVQQAPLPSVTLVEDRICGLQLTAC